MEKNMYLEIASRFIDTALDEVVRSVAENGEKMNLTETEKSAVMEAIEKQQLEGKEFAGLQIRHMPLRDNQTIPSLAINVLNRDEAGNLDVTTAFANAAEKNGIEMYRANVKDTKPLEEMKGKKTLEKNANLFVEKQPEILKKFLEDIAKNAKDIDLSSAVDEKNIEVLKRVKESGLRFENILQETKPEDLAKMLGEREFRDGIAEALATYQNNMEKIKEMTKTPTLESEAKSTEFNIREHMNMDEIAKLDNLPEKARASVEDHINKTIPAKDISKDDMFSLSISDEQEGKFVVYVLEEKNQANQIMAMTVENGEIEKGGNLPYQENWKKYSAEMEARNAAIIEGVGAIDEKLKVNEVKELQKDVKKDITKPIEYSGKNKDGKLLTEKDINNTAIFNAHLEGKMAELQALLRNAEVNGFDEKSVACVRDCIDGINSELQTTNTKQANIDKTMQKDIEKIGVASPSYNELRETMHKNANVVKRFGAKTLDMIGDNCKVAIARHMTNRETRASLDDEFARQQARRFYAVDYSAAKLDIAKANKEINKIETKYAKKLMQKNNSFINRLRGKTYTLKDVMPSEKYRQISNLKKVIESKESDLERIKGAYSRSLEVSRERLTEMKEIRKDVGLEDKSLDRKLDKKLDAVKNDKGLDKDEGMERER